MKKKIEVVGWGTMYNETCVFCGEPSSVYIDGFKIGSCEPMEPACKECVRQCDKDHIAEILSKIFR